jgi:hypothetical protein
MFQILIESFRRKLAMVLVILNEMRFEATKFETRTMPTPDMKGKEVIYWIKVETRDKRLATELHRFLSGSSQYIELHVPSAFIAAKTELEDYKPHSPRNFSSASESRASAIQEQQGENEGNFLIEIILRRLLPEARTGHSQSPYG